ncbi:MAG: hypothetical protein ABIF08_01945 [Nanoarchaeota archaeon]
MTIELLYMIVFVRIINSLLLTYLVSFYWSSFRKIKSEFTLGLLIFSALLLLNNLSAIYLRMLSGVDYADEIFLHNLILNLLQLGGLIPLVYITKK